ncbi:MAG: dockerin type I domain-containing protein [Patescibacteria group bacterium]
MKKAANRKVSRSARIRSKPKNSFLLLAILIIAVVGIAVWAVIANNPGKTPFALTPKLTAVSCSQVDFDHDGAVTILDITLMANANGTKAGDANYNKAYDLNGDDLISKLDTDIASGFFGQKCDLIVNSDTDRDGFSDKVEGYIGTSPNKVCGVNAWPVDVDGDRAVTILDMTKVANSYNTKTGDAKYNKRYDMDANGAIAIEDLNIVASYFLQKCSEPVTISVSERPDVNSFIPKPTPSSTACTFTNSAGKVQKYGDVNNNKYITAGDATLVKRSVAGIDPALLGDAKKAADVDGNGTITTADSDLILQFYFKTIAMFPACPAVAL